jgi:hypothetical protein
MYIRWIHGNQAGVEEGINLAAAQNAIDSGMAVSLEPSPPVQEVEDPVRVPDLGPIPTLADVAPPITDPNPVLVTDHGAASPAEPAAGAEPPAEPAAGAEPPAEPVVDPAA